MSALLRRGPVAVGPSPLGGLGVHATAPIGAGTVIEECPVVPVAEAGGLADRVIAWPDPVRPLAMQLGFGAIYNHAADPNAHWWIDPRRELMIIAARREIAEGEEVLIDYGEDWFPARGLRSV